jgi:hypothetical protein
MLYIFQLYLHIQLVLGVGFRSLLLEHVHLESETRINPEYQHSLLPAYRGQVYHHKRR